MLILAKLLEIGDILFPPSHKEKEYSTEVREPRYPYPLFFYPGDYETMSSPKISDSLEKMQKKINQLEERLEKMEKKGGGDDKKKARKK